MNRLDAVAIVAAAAQAEMALNRGDPVAGALVALAARSAAAVVGGRELALAAEITRRVDVTAPTPAAAASRKVAQALCRSALQQAQAALIA
ncbi:MAG: hypothetical protein HYX33_00795 [Actinobacteria bacterium]|nr:hypothetical protein [Actinomycetota bacterium]